MARRLRTVASLLWLLPALAVGGMWARSCQTLDEFSAVNGDNVLRAAVSYRGAVHWVRAERNGTPRKLAWDTYDVPAAATWGDLYALDDLDWRHAGFAKFSAPKLAPVLVPPAGPMMVVPPRGTPPTGPRRPPPALTRVPGAAPPGVLMPPLARQRPKIAPWLFTPPYTAYAVPYWPALAVTSVPALRVVVRFVRRWRRARRGLCPGCGYDLRAAGDRCPECGEPVRRQRKAAP
jgi:hypothetical protein